jgi:hypothetical protein
MRTLGPVWTSAENFFPRRFDSRSVQYVVSRYTVLRHPDPRWRGTDYEIIRQLLTLIYSYQS